MVLTAYDPVWAAMAASESRAIMEVCGEACGPAVLRVEHRQHVGAGLLAEARDRSDAAGAELRGGVRVRRADPKAGVLVRGEFGIVGRHLFIKGDRALALCMLVEGSRRPSGIWPCDQLGPARSSRGGTRN